MTKGFSYLMYIYMNVKERDGKYYTQLPTREIEVMDDKPYLEYFANGGDVKTFMQKADVWGEDLTEYNEFYETVAANLTKISAGESLL